MALTWRAVVLTALGAVAVLLVPVPGTVLAWALVVVVLCALDVALAASPRRVALRREVPASVRLTQPARSVLTLENRAARGTRYAVRHTIRATFSSLTMRWTGVVVLAFILYHLAHFSLGLAQADTFKTALPPYTMAAAYHVFGIPVVAAGAQVLDVHSMMILGFQNAIVSVFYIVAIGLLSLHLLHGVDSMFQTFGWRNARWSGALRKVAMLYCALYFIGNLAIPGAVLLGHLQPRAEVQAALAHR